MLKSGFWKLTALCLLIIATPLATPSVAGDGNADIVLGQANFTCSAANSPDARKLNSPQGVAIDASGDLYVADVQNSRVLGWKGVNGVTAFSNGAPADLVIGQPDFCSTAYNSGGTSGSSLYYPLGVAVDGSGNLYVADTSNNRVLEYTTPFAGCSSFPCVGGSANMVFGQGRSFTSNTANKGGEPSANNLNSPSGVAVDANGNLYVADRSNNRVLEYTTPLTNGATANLVFGQGGSFTSHTANNGGSPSSANSLYLPVGVAVDASGDLYVADSENNRVLEYNTPLTNGTTANLVFGQGDLNSNAPNDGGLGATTSLNYPSGVAVDASGDLYVADYLNNRVLEYTTPLTNSTAANLVFGQGGIFGATGCNSDTGGGNPTDDDLCNPWGVAADASGNLYVADTSNNRVLKYNPPFATNPIADVALGQHDFLHNQPNFPDQSSLDNPFAVTIDTSGDASGAKTHLYVADLSNSRVLGWNDVTAFTNGASADLVIGQPDPYTIACNSDTDGGNPTGDDLCNPYGVAVDGGGNLYVADASNNRVLEYTTPFAECDSFPCVGGSANLVFGQGGSFTSAGCNSDTEGGNPTANDQCYPSGVAVDAAGNLYVADASNNRVLEYDAPLTNGASANMVFGQGGSFTSNTANKGGASKKSLSYPSGVAVDSTGNLYVADFNNSRVLEYNTPLTVTTTPGSGDTTADLVFGQDGTFTWIGCNSHTTGSNPSAKNLCYPNSVAVDAAGNLYVADSGNSRLLEYNTPLTIGTTADRVFGQGDSFTSGGCNFGATSASADSLCSPSAAAVDTTTGHLYIADTYNNRVLEYDDSLPAEPTSVSVTASFAFGSSPVGDTVSRTITVANIGTNPLFIGSVTSSDPTEYAVTGAGTCGAIPVTVPPKTSCTLGVAFTPNAAGSHSATLSVNDNTATSPQHVALSGTGTVDMTVTPTSYAFGDVKDGSKAIKAIVVHNYRSNLVSLREGFGGSNHGDFSITGGTCGATLAAKAACTLLVTFAPTAVGTESATMTVTDSPDSLGPYTVTFTASATIPESLSAKTLIFGNVVQTASKTLSITLTNNSSGGSITLTGPSFGGTNPTDFSISNSSSCGESLAAASSCTYAVTFTPSRETAESGTLSIGVAQDPNGGPPAVSLSGTGVTPLKVIPASLTFGTVKRGKTSAAKTITVTNSGGAGVPLSESITIIKGNSGDFAVTGGICGTSLGGGGASCTYLLTFTPSIVGAESATLGVRAVGDGASPHNVSLSGTGS
jgi:sugar lactone lactonase YvrE